VLSGSLPFGWTIANVLVFRKIRAALGLDQCRLCLTSAAPITKDTLEFFMSLDMNILEIFGMSESSGECPSVSPQFSFHLRDTRKNLDNFVLNEFRRRYLSEMNYARLHWERGIENF
jgi:long-subunit acyl-CoA synthetase (AMP-forming)